MGVPHCLRGASCACLSGGRCGWINPLPPLYFGARPRCPVPVQQAFEKKFGASSHGRTTGLTEASPVATLNPEARRLPGSIGKVLPGIRAENRRGIGGGSSPAGEVGEICIRGDNYVMKGYYHQEEATRQKRFLDPE